ncbi:hypothetical protein FNN61_01475 [Salmonella enterica subsp. diarizonae]|nr:hypothetical protein [Salmonella enterica subsp. diarizonae]ECJ2328962.1 hypothetical protein [Salmonella enterica subsp. diarizonae]ECJ2468098.1 hypothetical protein [Salmonella enterica subsp. diarizonae]ECJ4764812.1 hypothetical protein [Salmonella enterica subsp. diarizonae]EDT3652571.1 hypothetical protein [Salmonella enterica subsp. diarizonae]
MILCVHKGVPNEKNHYKKTSNYAALRCLLNKQIQFWRSIRHSARLMRALAFIGSTFLISGEWLR